VTSSDFKVLNNEQLALEIVSKARSLGYYKCGIIKVSDVGDYAELLQRRMSDYPDAKIMLDRFISFAEPAKIFPWAKSIVVCIHDKGRYKIPANLQGMIGKDFLVDTRRRKDTVEFQSSLTFEAYLTGLGLQVETHRDYGLTSLRLAAMRAGLGLIRRNNFFYSDQGSSVSIEAWLIDREMELKDKVMVKPCPEKCGKCIKACPTKALAAPFSMNPLKCASFLTHNSNVDWINHPLATLMDGWIYGCDACQDACPFNQVSRRDKVLDFPGLTELGKELSLTGILEMSYEYLSQKLAPVFWYIPVERLWTWKVNVLNVMYNYYTDEYRDSILLAIKDQNQQVRDMARRVFDKHFKSVKSV
jgi:epoxyqueuosine reductase